MFKGSGIKLLKHAQGNQDYYYMFHSDLIVDLIHDVIIKL